MYHGRIVDTVDKDEVDDRRRSSAMIILGKKPGEVTEKEHGRARAVAADGGRARPRRGRAAQASAWNVGASAGYSSR